MARRTMLYLIGANVYPLAAAAQERNKIPRVGILLPEPPPVSFYDAFRDGLRGLGYVEGDTILLLPRWTDGRQIEQFKTLAAELVRLPVDIIVAGHTPTAIAAKDATNTIPVVMAALGAGDPVELGLVASLSRPGGNVTGMSLQTIELPGKRLELIKELAPTASRIALVLVGTDFYRGVAKNYQAPAQKLGLQVQFIEVQDPTNLVAAFAAAKAGKVQAVVLTQHALFHSNDKTIADLSLRHLLPVLSGETGFAAAGGLMNYGPNIAVSWHTAATYVDKILKGAKPGDLPIQQPTKFELVINLKSAKVLGLTVPASLLARADEVIE